MPTQHAPPPAPPAPPAWRENELANPHADTEKAGKVRRMFAAIAGAYDLNNRVHSLWRDQAWRRFAVRAAAVRPGERVLDVACGTGDLTQAFARSPAAGVIGMDFTPEMLDVARAKKQRLESVPASKITYMQGDAQDLPFPANSFDVVSIAFGIRNVESPRRALAEFRRVLRPGGRLIVLEFDRPSWGPLRWFNDMYCAKIMPRTATLISGDRSGAYKYLPASVSTFMTRDDMCAAMAETGMSGVSATPLTFGICVCYRADVSPTAAASA
ncbi:MAG: bifunctional demethylmenaquinone methyltransferase/2-methoxy-6-polyprenyl-1,4-benzoquinol methylase UbiE [Phycisphaeraceae bacterium]|nr:bifunctional demethylmenaquinone methyltransferase/2-methoxy-6-polyprenyl-1,4-benzoquinol methylase UbiE [Phycisphaeraceae bacterium]